MAKAIHFNSRRKDRGFVTINCGAIPKDLIESELFGHVKGSFTGAFANKRGLVEEATADSVSGRNRRIAARIAGEMLRLIQQGEVEKVGAMNAGTVDVRVIAPPSNLQAMMEDGTFREDLYYRLTVIPLELPPLRDRPEDIPELVQHFS